MQKCFDRNIVVIDISLKLPTHARIHKVQPHNYIQNSHIDLLIHNLQMTSRSEGRCEQLQVW